jgi:glycosyltransferase involved in cell wall biosynthesis
VAAEKIVVVPNGVDHAVFHPAGDGAIKRALRDQLGLPQDTFLALFVGGDWERKGVRDAIDAVAGLADTMLVILGSGDEAAMGAHANRAGAARQVRFAGLTHAPQDWYSACDAFVFPSRYEAFSLVTLEAAASGLPIVAHAINGTEELVADGTNGWLVPFGADALRQKLALLRDDSSLLARMSAAAVKASERYGWDRIADEQFAVFQSAAERAGGRGGSADAFPSAPARPRPVTAVGAPARLRTLQVGMEWFPEKPGGLNRMYYEITRHLEDVNVQVHGLIAGSDAARRDSDGMVEGFAPHTEALLPRLLAVRRMARPLLRGDPGLLLVTHFALYAAPLLGELHGRPMVVHFHGPWALEGEAEQQSGVTVFTKSLVERAVYRRATSFIVLSRPFGAILERLGVAAARIHVIPGGVDASRFATGESREACRAHFAWPGDRPIVLTVRRLMRRMGLDDLVAAAELLRTRVPNVLVLIAGRGPMADELHATIHRKGLQDHVRLIGFVADEDLPRAYRAADLTVVPSVALEGFGLVVAESLAAGTPCLVTPVGGLPEAVHGLSPHLILADTGARAIADGVAAALTGTLPMPGARACAEFARRNYDWPVIVARTRQVYEEALR